VQKFEHEVAYLKFFCLFLAGIPSCHQSALSPHTNVIRSQPMDRLLSFEYICRKIAGEPMAVQDAQFIVAEDGKKHLRAINIYVRNRRTSVRLSPIVARAVEKIAKRERCDLDDLYSYIDRKKEKGVSRATAIRDFALGYFVEAGTMAGHRRAGHGKLIRKHGPRFRAGQSRNSQGKKAA
jgi:predicted DNA-binding ribbon-helix-helix protein